MNSVYTTLKTWIENYWVAEKDSEALAALIAFAKGDLIKVLPTQASRLLESLQTVRAFFFKVNFVLVGFGV